MAKTDSQSSKTTPFSLQAVDVQIVSVVVFHWFLSSSELFFMTFSALPLPPVVHGCSASCIERQGFRSFGVVSPPAPSNSSPSPTSLNSCYTDGCIITERLTDVLCSGEAHFSPLASLSYKHDAAVNSYFLFLLNLLLTYIQKAWIGPLLLLCAPGSYRCYVTPSLWATLGLP